MAWFYLELTQSLVLAELGNIRPPDVLRTKLNTIYSLAVEPNPIHGFRSLGSAALNMCMVACGSADAYFEYGIHCWDIAAADVIVREAGGVTMYPTGEPLDVMKRGVLCASSNQLAQQVCPHIGHLQYPYDQTD